MTTTVHRPSHKELFDDMHADNIAAHNAGKKAGRKARGTRRVLPPVMPDGLSNDEAYWWNEGFHGRPFNPGTDVDALHAHWKRKYPANNALPEPPPES